jgi:CheY-like chemotaxis protein
LGKVTRKIEILSVEDNLADQHMLKEEFSLCETPHHLRLVSNGEEAMDYVLRRHPYSNAPTPDLILLDLNLPIKDGLEVLREIKSIGSLKDIPVIVMSTSSLGRDISVAYAEGASGYICKPADFSAFKEIIKSIESYWLKVVQLPRVAVP